jgi:hypothetical protein
LPILSLSFSRARMHGEYATVVTTAAILAAFVA